MPVFRYLAVRAKRKAEEKQKAEEYRKIINRRDAEEKYISMLLSRRIRLRDIPRWLLEDPEATASIHVSAFRADRGTSKHWYDEDLLFLEAEIRMARDDGNKALAETLEWCKKWGYMGRDICR